MADRRASHRDAAAVPVLPPINAKASRSQFMTQ
jgi:hypothetical protein